MKRIACGYLAGVLSVCALLVHLGADFFLTVGAKWDAAGKTYLVHSEPMRELDESLVPSALAYETTNQPAYRPVKPTKGAKKR